MTTIPLGVVPTFTVVVTVFVAPSITEMILCWASVAYIVLVVEFTAMPLPPNQPFIVAVILLEAPSITKMFPE